MQNGKSIMDFAVSGKVYASELLFKGAGSQRRSNEKIVSGKFLLSTVIVLLRSLLE